MRKFDLEREYILWKKRTKKLEKRKRTRKRYKSQFSARDKIFEFQFSQDKRVLSNTEFRLHNYLVARNFIKEKESVLSVSLPEVFSLKDNYEHTLESISKIAASLAESFGNKITLDFSKCKHVDFSALFLVKILVKEYQDYFAKLQKRLKVVRVILKVEVINSLYNEVNVSLLLLDLLDSKSGINLDGVDLEPIDSTGLIVGDKTQKHYLENKKGVASTLALDYINDKLKNHGYELTENGEANFMGIIGEVLNNAEDHSPFDRWYLTASFLQSQRSRTGGDFVGELNFGFFNFGFSVYEGFCETKDENMKMYSQLESSAKLMLERNPNLGLNEENLFTLLSLQEGVSRLKFESESRGTGTIKFINSFMAIGDYQDPSQKYNPYLQILTGKTRIVCDSKFKPFKKDDRYYISLNQSQNLEDPPSLKHLNSLKIGLPGTLLSVKVYLNEDHLTKKMQNNEN